MTGQAAVLDYTRIN